MLPSLVRDYVRPGKVSIDLRLIAVIGIGPREQSTMAATAAAVAAEENKLWQFSELFYLNQGVEESGYIADDFLADIYKAAGIDAKEAAKKQTGQKAQQSLLLNDQLAVELGADNIPSLYIYKGGNSYQEIRFDNGINYQTVRRALEKAPQS